jgi:dynein heavy chain
VLIAQACAFINGETIFALVEAEETHLAVEQIKTCLKVCTSFKRTYFMYKDTANAECPANPWRIQNNALFMRLDSFLERCSDILDLTQTIVQFSLLSKVEVGGTKGKALTDTVQQIHADFTAAVSKLSHVDYDIMDVGAKNFDNDYYDFRQRIKELERQLGSVLTQAFDDCNTNLSCFKLFDTFEPLLERPIIHDALEKRYIQLVQAFGVDLQIVQQYFVENRDQPPVNWNLPQIVGAVFWCRGLYDRIMEPFRKMQELNRVILEREESKEVCKVYQAIVSSLQEYENQKVEEWGRDIKASSQSKLKLPLLTRDPKSRTLAVNFEPGLVKLLREVKYFILLDITVPTAALEVFKKGETYRQQTGNLDLIVDAYNSMLKTMLPVEEPLFTSHFSKMDQIMARVIGADGMNWLSAEINDFIATAKENVEYSHGVLSALKKHMKEIEEILDSWKTPMLGRSAKPVSVEDFERAQKPIRQAKNQTLKDGSHHIVGLMKESNNVLKMSNGHPDWKSYVDFINDIVVEGVCNCVRMSLAFLLEQIDPDEIEKQELGPMLEISLTLKDKSVLFKPELRFNEGKGLRDQVNQWINNFFLTVLICKRLDIEGTFMRELHQDYNIQALMATVNSTLSETEASCDTLRESYEKFSDLWLLDIESEFKTFIKGAMAENEHGVRMVDLPKFDEEILKYNSIITTVGEMSSPVDIGWLKITTDPIKSSLHTWSSKWVYKYTMFLQEDVVSRLVDLQAFMDVANGGLQEEVAEGDDDSLKACMVVIRDVGNKVDGTRAMFEPLRDTLLLLKREGVGLDDIKVAEADLQEYLESAPLKWDRVVNKTFKKKETIMPLQNLKVEQIKEELEQFFLDMRTFRGSFRTDAPFKFKGAISEAYANMEDKASSMNEMAAQAAIWNVTEELFELQVSKYPEIESTAVEIKLLKLLWDFKDNVMCTFVDWKKALWCDVNTEDLEDATKNILKEVRTQGNLNPMIKGWEVYRDIEKLVKDMAVVLPLVNSLHSPAMRDRHWKSLSTLCGLTSVIDPDDKGFCLDDMLSLNLHTHVDDVEEIVETANKELKIEKKLTIIESCWKELLMDYKPHKESEISLIAPSEDVIENLEAHQLELQTMIGMGKFVDYFRDRVMYWQKSLGEVEEVISEWSKVCKSWAALESIFLASADIRAQLPDDTKRFEGIDTEFKDMMKEAVNITNVIEVCCAEGRADALKDMTKRLELCQRALNEYLDVKKKIFPRFYFVSNVALLEILSNGNNPPQIMSFIGDCYDSLNKLVQPKPGSELGDLHPEYAENWSKIGMKIVAKDGEIIDLPEPFEMIGAVEGWLNELTEAMRHCLRGKFDKALEQAAQWEVEKPRHLWLFDWPAQIVLTGTQIFWTEETELSLEEFEGGQEDAIKRVYLQQISRLDNLIQLVLGKLSSPDRCKIIALITMDVHSRDVDKKLIDQKIPGPAAFLWQQQMRQYWEQKLTDVNIKICDFGCKYFYEWIGNTGRLVITPLTDRCYITLTMALRLYLGGAPAGPAGTGKTETTKDLARALAIPCYVFNCSDQMNFETLGDIFRGLCQSGSWGCFDEFNRISIEVLSVVATQVKTIQDSIVRFSVPMNREEEFQHFAPGCPPHRLGDFEFMGDTIGLIPTCGFWITMNPGYAGRTELPENLKVLFRSCAMIRPDLRPICENMLMSEGFLTAGVLAIKFVTLYQLCLELLSPQVHYDWGLRAVKSVLRVAGTLKRADPDWPEMKVLMRALRDFNTPKIPLCDSPIFLRLIADLFMGIEVAPKQNEFLWAKAIISAKARGLQYDDAFLLKVCQFQELLDVRHSVMLLGPTGCSKTTIWKTLSDCHNLKEDHKELELSQVFKAKATCVWEQVNPKSVITDELYGYMTLSKDWRDGCLSIIMRGMAKCFAEQAFHEYQSYKWAVLDGDIDALWIESMNTVMDDNKVLTLVSNERIPLSAAMRMVFEINSLKNASPATVSRAGILYINESDVGWRPFMESWVAFRVDEQERNFLPGLFDKYIDPVVDFMRKGFKKCTPVMLLNAIQTVCYILQGVFDPDAHGEGGVSEQDKTQEVMEDYFVFATTWSFGGPLVVDKGHGIDSKKDFHEMFAATFPNTKYPKEGMCYDYYYDLETNEFIHWTTKVPEYVPVPIGQGHGASAFTEIVVSTVDTVRLTFLMDILVKNGHGVMFVGGAGTGKTTMVNNYLNHQDAEKTLFTGINMNYYTDSKAFQALFEQNIDKRSGRMFGPPTGKKMIFYVDDLNLPYIEEYGTQNSLELMRQIMDHGSLFDRLELGFRKEIVDCQQIASMNPLIGSMFVSERNQMKYACFACMMPGPDDLRTIYGNVLAGHMELQGMDKKVLAIAEHLAETAIHLHGEVVHKFLPSAIKFVYNWNMRELTNIFQGVTLSKADDYTKPMQMCKLFVHEAQRVFSDRMVNEEDQLKYQDCLKEVTKKWLHSEDQTELHAAPNIFTGFHTITSGESKYLPITTFQQLNDCLEGRLLEYNESNSIMELVLFQDAMEHIQRICRIISNPRGNAMLIGVGGSGKQSLTKLASFICGYEIKQLSVTSNFRVDDLKESLKELYKVAGVKGIPTTFLMTDTQIVNEKFLVYINDMLSSGWIPDLFARDEMDALFGGLRNEAKANNIPDTAVDMLNFFLLRVRTNLHIVLCFSPVGDLFRLRARRFPGLINCTAIDWFQKWPRDALISVAGRFLADVELGDPVIKENLAIHMAEVHLSVDSRSLRYLATQRRFNYVTPKSFLELISFYRLKLEEKRGTVQGLIDRLDVGLSTLRKTAADVAELQIDLKHTMEVVEEKKAATDVLLQNMGVERKGAEAQQEVARVEETKSNAAAAAAAKIETEADKELSQAKPAMEAAAEAVDCLSKAMLTELKSLPKPPAGVDVVTAACLMMLEHEFKNLKWDRAKKMMANVDKFKESLQNYDARYMDDKLITKLTPICSEESFTPEAMASKSAAAANLCTWVVASYTFNRIYVKVKPLMDSLEAAKADKAAAEQSLAAVMEVVAKVEAKLAELQATFEHATSEKQAIEAKAAACNDRLGLAHRLIGGLSSENERWGFEIEQYHVKAGLLIGDIMLSSAFVSYIGAFDKPNREFLWQKVWLQDLIAKGIPLSEGVDPLDQLTDDANNAQMSSEGLPTDRISIENGSIIVNCKRWPLLIDPQLQGIKWLRTKEENNGMVVLSLTAKRWLASLEHAISNGTTIIIENLGEEVDATLDPVLSRAVYRKGRGLFLKVGGEEVEYDQRFKLYLQTKLANPHYKPEIAAQCTLINFIATEVGLEDQLLQKVVKEEQPVMEAEKQELVAAFQRYKIQLHQLEDNLLERLANAPDDILSDVPLIEGLEETKAAATKINAAVAKGKITEEGINKAREVYRVVATEGAMMYFMLTQLCVISHMYQYSLDSFVIYFFKAIERAAPAETQAERVGVLRESLRYTIFQWCCRGLFEAHKLIYLSMITFQLIKRKQLDVEVDQNLFRFLMFAPKKVAGENPLDWLPKSAWDSVQALGDLEDFTRFPGDLVEAAPRFQEWYNASTPETEKLPLDWAGLDKTPFLKMLVVRCLRPDRMTVAVENFVTAVLPHGSKYAKCDSTLNANQIIDASLSDATTVTPMFFILSPGVDVVAEVDKLGLKYGYEAGTSYHNVSMGQGQDIVAEDRMEQAHRNGHWVILNNIHLMPTWCIRLEKRLDEYALEGSHSRFRLFLTADPNNGIPIGLLDRSIKLTNEPPAGLAANLKRAFCSFPKEYIDEADSKTKSILFGLCHFHAVLMERKMYGPMGYNMMYPFSLGDLRDSSVCLANYMESNAGGKIPWADLRYIFGEIMYGGHIVNDFDRLVANTYLEWYMKDDLLEETEMYPYAEDEKSLSFRTPLPTSYDRYLDHIDEELKIDTPVAFGLHTNAEIDFRTTMSNKMFHLLVELDNAGGGAGGDDEDGGGGGASPEEIAAQQMQEIIDAYTDKKFDQEDVARSCEEVGPYQNVFLQEIEQLNKLHTEMMRSLLELSLGFKGELSMSDAMDELCGCLSLDRLPAKWAKAYPSLRGLTTWLFDLNMRLHQVEEWCGNPMDIPKVTWISGLITPQSFLTAIMQVTAQKNQLELDKLQVATDCLKKMTAEEVDAPSRDGAYISGMIMQGARFDVTSGIVEKSKPKEMYCPMPVVNCRAVLSEKIPKNNIYLVPCYKTTSRGPTWVFCAQLQTKSPAGRWILAGVGLIFDVS